MGMTNALNLLCGLALFLYGMHVMGEGLTRASGGKLESILESLTKSKIKAVLLGAGVTAIIQSSSATTVMVVGFVNSGIMRLSQAAGVIMGANIGTTVTSWILSLTGLQGDSLLLTLCKPATFTPVLAFIGVCLLLFAKGDKKHDAGSIMIGFAVLMTGMEMMSGAVKPLADVPEFTNILLMFTNPILGVIAGAVLTAIIQSSSASVGILQALCVTGAVKYSAALPIIMGQNIGTCVTALLSAVGASKNAKRAAMVHLYFNIIGTAIFMSLFYFLHLFVDFSFMSQAAGPAGIAVIHSMFNIFATLVLLPFSKGLEKLACLTIRDKKNTQAPAVENQEFLTLDQRFLEKPAFAMEQSRHAASRMAESAQDAFSDALSLLTVYDEAKASFVETTEEKVDRYEDELGTYLVKLNQKDLSSRDSHDLSIMLHCIGDFERISDHAVNILGAARELDQKKLAFSDEALAELSVLCRAVKDIVKTAVTVFEEKDTVLAGKVEPLEEVIDELNQELKKRHVQRLRDEKCTIEMGFILSDIITDLERVADHCSNIAVCILQIQEDSFDTHSYLEQVKSQSNEEFHRIVAKEREQYVLP